MNQKVWGINAHYHRKCSYIVFGVNRFDPSHRRLPWIPYIDCHMPKGWWSPASLTLTRTPASIHGFSHFFVYYTHVHVRTKEILPSPPSSGDLHQITLRASLCRKRLEGLFSSQLQCLGNRTQGKWLLLCQWANSNLPCFFWDDGGACCFQIVKPKNWILERKRNQLPSATGILCQSVFVVLVIFVSLLISPFAILMFRRASIRFWCSFERVWVCFEQTFFKEHAWGF